MKPPLFGERNPSYKHGMSGTPTWNTWRAMRRRIDGGDCSSHLYVGLGLHEPWRQFVNFYKDMGERPKGTTIDRIDGSKGYYPGNCRWATAKQQRDNSKRELGVVYKNSKLIEFNGQKATAAELARRIGISVQTLNYRIKVGKPLTDPLRPWGR